ncbi:MAG: hypothetical protein WBA57_19225 [Elainellaceae cyanobacterium]
MKSRAQDQRQGRFELPLLSQASTSDLTQQLLIEGQRMGAPDEANHKNISPLLLRAVDFVRSIANG